MTRRFITQVFFLEVAFILYPMAISKPVFPGRQRDVKGGIRPNATTSGTTSIASRTCNNTYVSPLNDAQKVQLRAAMTDHTILQRLDEIQKGEANIMMTSPEIQQPIVTLTSIQKRQILQNYGELFTKKPENIRDFQEQGRMRRSLSSTEGDIFGTTVPSPQDLVGGGKRSVPKATGNRVNGPRICPPKQVYKALVIGWDENNNPVQIVQFPEDDAQQWFLEETCETDKSLLIAGAKCGVSDDRLVNAYIVDLVDKEQIHMGKIRVHSCVSFL